MCDYSNFKFNLKDNFNYENYKINYKKHNIVSTTVKPLLKSINCVKVENDKNYDCEVTKYSLRISIIESIP